MTYCLRQDGRPLRIAGLRQDAGSRSELPACVPTMSLAQHYHAGFFNRLGYRLAMMLQQRRYISIIA
ncbi:MAG: hypothetical protein FWD31_10645 [Planctomycetaceae bacterium]|nr:hypothetical protein [Planctomycetaceae bacterium]